MGQVPTPKEQVSGFGLVFVFFTILFCMHGWVDTNDTPANSHRTYTVEQAHDLNIWLTLAWVVSLAVTCHGLIRVWRERR